MNLMEDFLSNFKKDCNQTTYKFENFLTRLQREEVHNLCDRLGLYHQSYGSGSMRRIIVSKEKMDIEISEDDRKIFINDSSFPITVTRDPWFSEQIKSLDPLFGTKEKYKVFVETCKILSKQDQPFKTFYYNLSDKIIKYIKTQPCYKELLINNNNFKEKEIPNETNIYKNYINDFDKVYISLDIIQANFTCLRKFYPDLFDGCNTWTEFVKKFTDLEYFTTAKYFRQITFGKLNAKQISSIEKYLMGEFYQHIKNWVNVIGRIGSDEIFIVSTRKTWKEDVELIKQILDKNQLNDIWRVNAFTLKQLGNSRALIKTNLDNNKISIKSIEKDFYLQAYRYYMNQVVIESDKIGMKDGYIIRYEDLYEFE